MNNGNSKKRAPPPPAAAQQQKHYAAMEEEEMDEDVFLDENLCDEEALLLRDMEEREALASCLQKWKRPALSEPYLSQSQNIGKSMLISSSFCLIAVVYRV
ncbi:hypothetical protein RJ639_008271 [Escallonia herrerae]|uniref:Uncharacterized protein n=1 Tax=Escallonia herrerae TaxID=1293975 RepID=A0AA89ASE6_9ASTE|nr:hypothetical protein RJ639_008271 [Escallonia herrerae]